MAKRRGRNLSKRGQSRGKRTSKTVSSKPVMLRSTHEKIKAVVKYILTSLFLTIVSFVLYKVVSSPFWNDLFFLLLMVLGFVTLAFVIVWLVLLWLKTLGK
ncbi:hypothetical protein A3K62_00845 [Candidatus Pacearchaeota archaeon RBG_16_35_8]|nr:MAG: hypothetical protein A3K62_00845 [Candidatus Pacearchaeota archaeon RBG_16_35_8]